MKKCYACKETKAHTEFNKHRSEKDGYQPLCRVCQCASNKKYRDKDIHTYRIKQREKLYKIRQEVLDAYGNVCSCCGEHRSEFIAIDHTYGGGNRERKAEKGRKIYWKVRQQGFPKEYRLLCHNCNTSMGIWGYCPHELECWAY